MNKIRWTLGLGLISQHPGDFFNPIVSIEDIQQKPTILSTAEDSNGVGGMSTNQRDASRKHAGMLQLECKRHLWLEDTVPTSPFVQCVTRTLCHTIFSRVDNTIKQWFENAAITFLWCFSDFRGVHLT